MRCSPGCHEPCPCQLVFCGADLRVSVFVAIVDAARPAPRSVAVVLIGELNAVRGRPGARQSPDRLAQSRGHARDRVLNRVHLYSFAGLAPIYRVATRRSDAAGAFSTAGLGSAATPEAAFAMLIAPASCGAIICSNRPRSSSNVSVAGA